MCASRYHQYALICPQIARSLPLGRVVKPLENPADVPVPFAVVPGRRKLDGSTGAKKLFDLFNRTNPLFVHVDHHPQDDQPTYPSPSASSLQAHSSLDKARACTTGVSGGQFQQPRGQLETDRETTMHLSKFIRENSEGILQEWEYFAASYLSDAEYMNKAQLRGHLAEMLVTIASDLANSQTAQEQSQKSKGQRSEEH